MRIFLAFMQSHKQHSIPAYAFWQHYIKNGIQEAGHQWTECAEVDWALGLLPKSDNEQARWRDDAWSKTLAYLKKHPPDIFLSYLYPCQIDTSAIAEIKKLGIPCVNFFCDHVREFTSIPIEFEAFTLNWVPEYKAIKQYAKAGYPYINLPMPMWVAPKLRVQVPESNKQVTFIGSHDVQRQLLFEYMVTASPHLPLAVYGNGWSDASDYHAPAVHYSLNKKVNYQYQFIKNNGFIPYLRKLKQRNSVAPVSNSLRSKLHGTTDFDSYCQLTAQSMITLGVNRYPSFHYPIGKPNTYSRLRDIEAPMLGACYLTEWTEGLEHLYDLDNEINTYKNADELIERINILQHDKVRRKKLRMNGQKRALQDHTIPQSLKKISAALNL